NQIGCMDDHDPFFPSKSRNSRRHRPSSSSIRPSNAPHGPSARLRAVGLLTPFPRQPLSNGSRRTGRPWPRPSSSRCQCFVGVISALVVPTALTKPRIWFREPFHCPIPCPSLGTHTLEIPPAHVEHLHHRSGLLMDNRPTGSRNTR